VAIIRGGNEATFAIRVEGQPEDELRVLRVRGEEGISMPFRFELELVSDNPGVDLAGVVGKTAALAIRGYEKDRYVHAVVSRFEQGAIGTRFTRYFAQLVPRFWKLSLREDSRMFQEKSVPDILKAVLDGAGVPSTGYRLSLQSAYKPREYCVQYRESDLAFLSRLMEEEGIFYFFEHKEDDHVLVIADDPSVFAAIAGDANVTYREPSGAVPEQEYVGAFRYSESVRIGAVAMRDYNFMRPATNLEARDQASQDDDLEYYEFPGRYLAADEGKRLASLRLAEQQALRKVAVGASVSQRFVPGAKFTLTDHRREEWNREWLLTDVLHEGYEPQALEEEQIRAGASVQPEYTNEFRCIPSDVAYRPLRATPRPIVHGPQTAIVTGPSGEDIHTDEYGRVKVRFFWDRRAKDDDTSSAWVRAVQPGGTSSAFIPRVGQEVLVAFLNGDIDFPVVVGTLWNANRMPPYALPDTKTVTSLKSAHSPDKAAFNEIRFEDREGEEQMFVHAHKNMDVRIGENGYDLVGKDSHLIVKQDYFAHVENESHTRVDADDITLIGKDRHLKVKGKEAVEITGSKSLVVKDDVIEQFKMNHSEQVTMNYYLKAMQVVIEGMTNLTLKVGGNSVVLDPSGVTIKGMMVTVDGSMVRIASGPGTPAMSGQAGSPVSPLEPRDAEEADESDPAKMQQIKNEQKAEKKGKYGAAKAPAWKPEQASQPGEERQEKQKSWIEIELKDEDDSPVPGEPYEITLPDGTHVARGTLDQNGFARVQGIDPGDCKVSFPRLDKGAWAKAGGKGGGGGAAAGSGGKGGGSKGKGGGSTVENGGGTGKVAANGGNGGSGGGDSAGKGGGGPKGGYA
jgi:type VI secretion system secreted protein VgrG